MMKHWKMVVGAAAAGLLLGQSQPVLTKQTKLGCPASATAVQSLAQPVGGSTTTLVCIAYDPATFTFNAGTGVLSATPAAAGGNVPQFADAETPAGAVNGTNPTFTLAFAPNPALSLLLFRNGILQRAGADFTLSGNTVTFFNSANTNTVPQATDILQASYRH